MLVEGPAQYSFQVLSDVYGSAAVHPVVCGFDCASDVEQLAGQHESLELATVALGPLSWRVLYGRNHWRLSKPLHLEEVTPKVGVVADRYAAICEITKIDC